MQMPSCVAAEQGQLLQTARRHGFPVRAAALQLAYRPMHSIIVCPANPGRYRDIPAPHPCQDMLRIQTGQWSVCTAVTILREHRARAIVGVGRPNPCPHMLQR